MCMFVWDYSWGEQRNELPKSQSDESAPSPRVLQDARVPGSSAQALAMDVTRYSSSVFLHPHQLISGWLQRAITAPFFWCLRQKTEREDEKVVTLQAKSLETTQTLNNLKNIIYPFTLQTLQEETKHYCLQGKCPKILIVKVLIILKPMIWRKSLKTRI